MPPEDTANDSESPVPGGGLVGKIRAWTSGNPKRAMIVAIAFGVGAIATVVAWLAAANLAAGAEPVTIDVVLRALDDGENELAKSLVDQMQQQSSFDGGYGGPLFALGALKSREAVQQWSAERRRADFYIASRYLSEARTFGFPEGRDAEGLYLLGKSLIESRQLEAGIGVLIDAMDAGAEGSGGAHVVLAEAYFYSSTPRYAEAVEELEHALADTSLDAETRTAALLLCAESLAALGRHDDASAVFAELPETEASARRRLVGGKLLVMRLEQTPRRDRSLAEMATRMLTEARRLDKLSTRVSRESDYYLARLEELMGRPDEALARYDMLRRNHGSSAAGIAAALSEADLLRSRGEPEVAIESYRRVVNAMGDPAYYRSAVAPLSVIRTRLQAGHAGFVETGDYPQAIELIDHLAPLFPLAKQLELRASTLEMWGDQLIARSEAAGEGTNTKRRQGLARIRAAGVAYEQLAEAVFATEIFPDRLWAAADAYFRGQSYSNAARVIDRYLRHEPERRNALAHLRLGDCYLAMGRPRSAIDAFEECLEFHPDEGPSYRARVEGAKAYRLVDEHDQAERLLRENLAGDGRTVLRPTSPEWRDSLFELGRLLASQRRDAEAIDTLTEAIDRYPNDPQRLEAKYLVAEAHRHAAIAPQAAYAEANTVNERELALEAVRVELEAALVLYEELQREITRSESQDELDRVTIRNCYMLGGAVLFQLGRYEDAIASYSSISTLYQNEPFLLEAIVQISHCWRRLQDNVRAAGAVQQAKDLLARLPPDADFATSTNLNRNEWRQLLDELAEF